MWPRKREAQRGMQLQTIPALNSAVLGTLDTGQLCSTGRTCLSMKVETADHV